jgi:hypothetical protein
MVRCSEQTTGMSASVSPITALISDNENRDKKEDSYRLRDKTNVVERMPQDIRVIASGNQDIDDTTLRDKLNEDLDNCVLRMEIEAAGLINNFPMCRYSRYLPLCGFRMRTKIGGVPLLRLQRLQRSFSPYYQRRRWSSCQ